MFRFAYHSGLLLAVLLLLAGLAAPAPAAPPATESAPYFRAADLLPRSVLAGPEHRVDALVRNVDGINIYILHAPQGDLRVASTAMLYRRIHELQAAAAMDKVNTGAEFGRSVVDSGVDALKGAFNLVIHPIDTLSGAASGVGKAFRRTGDSMQSRRPDDEAGTAAGLVGYNQAKREYAKQFGVDPYARNRILQASLKRLAGAGTAGGLTGTVAKVAIPGGVGLAVGAASGTQALNDIDVSTPPEDLFARNRVRMEAMGVPAAVAARFIENVHFTPTGQSRLVAALSGMPSVRNRAAFIRLCALTDDDDLARYRERLAVLYANINATTDRLTRFEPIGAVMAATTTEGGFLVALPLDYLAWTPEMVTRAAVWDSAARAGRAGAKKLVVTGAASALARDRLRQTGWTVVCLREGLVPVEAAPDVTPRRRREEKKEGPRHKAHAPGTALKRAP